jgi:hypothetical protein
MTQIDSAVSHTASEQRMNQLHDRIKNKRLRRSIIHSLGDAEQDWHDTDSVDEILTAVRNIMSNEKLYGPASQQYLSRFGSTEALNEHFERIINENQ